MILLLPGVKSTTLNSTDVVMCMKYLERPTKLKNSVELRAL